MLVLTFTAKSTQQQKALIARNSLCEYFYDIVNAIVRDSGLRNEIETNFGIKSPEDWYKFNVNGIFL